MPRTTLGPGPTGTPLADPGSSGGPHAPDAPGATGSNATSGPEGAASSAGRPSARRAANTDPTTTSASRNAARPGSVTGAAGDITSPTPGDPGLNAEPTTSASDRAPVFGIIGEEAPLGGYAFPGALAVAIVVFLLVQHWLDGNDPKVQDAPLDRLDDLVHFVDEPIDLDRRTSAPPDRRGRATTVESAHPSAR